MGRAGVTMDEDVSPDLIRNAHGHLYLASGYLNLSPRYLSGVLKSKVRSGCGHLNRGFLAMLTTPIVYQWCDVAGNDGRAGRRPHGQRLSRRAR